MSILLKIVIEFVQVLTANLSKLNMFLHILSFKYSFKFFFSKNNLHFLADRGSTIAPPPPQTLAGPSVKNASFFYVLLALKNFLK